MVLAAVSGKLNDSGFFLENIEIYLTKHSIRKPGFFSEKIFS